MLKRKLNSADVIGTRLLQLEIQNFDINNDLWIWGGEPVYLGGKCVGSVANSGYCFMDDKLMCLSYVIGNFTEQLKQDSVFDIIVSGDRCKAKHI